MMKSFILLILTMLIVVQSYHLSSIKHPIAKKSLTTLLASTWQEDFDEFVNIDTACDSRKNIVSSLWNRFDVIVSDVVTAVREKNIEKLAPPSTKYGQDLKKAKVFREQLVTDIIPDLLTLQLPRLISEAPALAQKVISQSSPENIKKRTDKLTTFAKDLTQDPSLLQSTVDDLRKEVKNIFKSTPDGLATPAYIVLKKTSVYEIRQYNGYSVASTKLDVDGSTDESDMLVTGNSFNKLAAYILDGDNEESKSLSMTTPVIMGNGQMKFVLPDQLNSETAPKPSKQEVVIEDIPSEIVAVIEFSGIATEKEVSRQRALLEDTLLADGILYDNLSFKTLQYNPPYTLPWLRRNEVSLKVEYSPVSTEEDTIVVEPEVLENVYYSKPPEAGE